MIVKYIPGEDGETGRFHLVLDHDLAAMMCDDYVATFEHRGSYHPSAYDVFSRMNFLYFCHWGCSISQSMEDYEGLEQTEAPDE